MKPTVLDNATAALLRKQAEAGLALVETLDPSEARKTFAKAREACAINAALSLRTVDVDISEDGRTVPVRLYHPNEAADDGAPALVFFHGGGWVVGDIASYDDFCRGIAFASGCCVVSVGYRLAPEDKFPAAIEDATLAIRWLFQHSKRLGIDPDCIAVGGDSSGGNIAAVSAILARDGSLPKLRFQLLLYPATDLRMESPSHDISIPNLRVTGKTMRWFRGLYLGSEKEQSDWRASPLLAPNLEGVAPAYVLTAGGDPLVDEGIAYVDLLRAHGVEVQHRHHSDQIHGFLTLGNLVPKAAAARKEVSDVLSFALRPTRD